MKISVLLQTVFDVTREVPIFVCMMCFIFQVFYLNVYSSLLSSFLFLPIPNRASALLRGAGSDASVRWQFETSFFCHDLLFYGILMERWR